MRLNVSTICSIHLTLCQGSKRHDTDAFTTLKMEQEKEDLSLEIKGHFFHVTDSSRCDDSGQNLQKSSQVKKSGNLGLEGKSASGPIVLPQHRHRRLRVRT